MEVKSLPTPPDRPAIQSYGPDGVRIANMLYRGPILVLASGVIDWPVTSPALEERDFAMVFEHRTEFDVLLIGSGAKGADLPHAVAGRLRARGVPCELMDTGAACRTYNLLIAERRRAAAALLPPR